MVVRTQNVNFHNLDGTVDTTVTTHIYASTGHFEDSKGHRAGWHIQLGTSDSPENYTEIDDGTPHDVPESLPDIDVYEEEDESDAETADYEAALAKLGVVSDET